ncbi:MAG: alpha/beta hydrolase fold domain-containing protein [Deltaproteobacteria bacterium]|nr:alpha/beta hydrolase fold domain-containing protein [Deltaproteobacteria bacterium]
MRMKSVFVGLVIGAVLALSGSTLVERFSPPAPQSIFVSPEAADAAVNGPRALLPHVLEITTGPIEERRAALDRYYVEPRVEEARRAYPVEIAASTVGEVFTEVVTPTGGVPAENARRVLINLHGGGFSVGARSIGRLESIPVAHVARMKVVAVDYRQGPEFRFPAASEDVATVYRALLETHAPEQIGIFGCSAGGMLTAQAVAWFQAHDLPRPGAIGIFCAGAGGTGDGDARLITEALRVPPPGGGSMAYFEGADMRDPLVAPVFTPAVLARFPPTLVISGTRDMALSAALYTHGQLVAAGVEADLHVFEGLGHYFFADTRLPESKQAFAVMARFFDEHLGR